MKMFFYGIFRQYHDAGQHLERHGCKFLGEAVIPGLTLYTTPDNQGVFARPMEGGEIVGDLCEVPDEIVYHYVDGCEGHPHNYRRTEVLTTNGQACSVYVMQHPLENRGFPHVGRSWRHPDYE